MCPAEEFWGITKGSGSGVRMWLGGEWMMMMMMGDDIGR